MVEKLALPFPLLCDARAELIHRLDLWNEHEHVSAPAIFVVDRTGTVQYRYVGQDFADRPPDEDLFDVLDEISQDGVLDASEPAVRLTASQAQESVGPDRRAISLEQLVPYYRGVFYTTVALKGRFAAWTQNGRDVVREIGRYQRMVREFQDAIEATRKLKKD